MASEKDKDPYYERICYETLERVAEQNKDKSHKQIIKAWKQSYPFGTDRTGRKYKIWNKLWNHAKKCLVAGLIKFDS